MKLVEMIWRPTDRQLRQFGIIGLFAIPLAAWLFTGGNLEVVGIAAAVGAVMALVGWFLPQALRFPFVALCLIAFPIGLVISEVLLVLIYLLAFLPIGLARQLFAQDPMQRKIDGGATSYWQEKKQPEGPASYLRQW